MKSLVVGKEKIKSSNKKKMKGFQKNFSAIFLFNKVARLDIILRYFRPNNSFLGTMRL